MQPKPAITILLLFCFLGNVSGQRVKNESLVRSIHADHYFRFYYENDVIALTDYYYTSGMNIEFVKPSLQKNPLNKLFFHLPGSKMKYGIALDHYAFTPVHIIYDSISHGDRPYAGCISINSFRIATDPKRRRQISTSLIVGLIGPPALWKPVQTRLHKNLIPAPQPMGWDNQIKTDLILSYRLNFEKNLIGTKFFLLNGSGEAIAGTLNNKLTGGVHVMVGRIMDPFQYAEQNQDKKWQVYLYASSFLSAIGYDATLQGGFFNRKNVYTVPASEIKRFTFRTQTGIIFSYKKFYTELAESFLSKELKTGRTHIWGSLGIAFKLK
jgi:hypothetical protein